MGAPLARETDTCTRLEGGRFSVGVSVEMDDTVRYVGGVSQQRLVQ